MSNTNVLYLIGSLRNPRVPELARKLREKHPTLEVFDDWFAAGPEADDHWKRYEQGRGRTYEEALGGYAAGHVFDFDRFHLDRATHVLLVLPAGKSGHMEIMYAAYGAMGRPDVAILLDQEDVRWDVMYQFIPTIIGDDSGIDEWLSSGQRGEAERVSDGGWSTGLLPECIGGGVSSVLPSHLATPSWGTDALGQIEVDGSPEQDYAPFDGYWSIRRQGAASLNDGGVEGISLAPRGVGKGRGAPAVTSE